MPDRRTLPILPVRRIDLHCHSLAGIGMCREVNYRARCAESYSSPAQIYAHAKRRGMDFVTITDHDCMDGALQISAQVDVLPGEELSCWFPEDRCRIHVLLWGISRADHEALQALAPNIYTVAGYIARHRIAHAVAHPFYWQNLCLERWHIERLILLFKGFECLNGRQGTARGDTFDPIIRMLTGHEINRLAKRHALAPLWPDPHIKARTGGSNDQDLSRIGLTWTEFPPQTRSLRDVLECLRGGRCRPARHMSASTDAA